MKLLLDLEITLTGIVSVINPMIADLKNLKQFVPWCQLVSLSDSFTWAAVEMQLVLVLHDLSIVKGASVRV
jgi:hypothetical protein